MDYFIEIKTLKGKQDIYIPFTNFLIGKTKTKTELISIGISSENNDNYYFISKKFNIRHFINKYILTKKYFSPYKKLFNKEETELYEEFFLDDDILIDLYNDLESIYYNSKKENLKFSFNNLKYLIKKYGNTNKEISNKIKEILNTQSNINIITSNPIDLKIIFNKLGIKLENKIIDLKKHIINKEEESNKVFVENNKINLLINSKFKKINMSALDEAIYNKKIYNLLKSYDNRN